jgi:hypothetical protein
MNKLIIAAVIIVGLGVAYLMLDYLLVYAQGFPTLPPSNSTSLSLLSNQSGQSLVESFGSPEVKKPGLTDRMIDDCGVLETDRSIEEGKESLECQERIMNESK